MATAPRAPRNGARRRVVLVDLDWSEVDLVPELLRHPGLHVVRVGGEHADDPGMRVAELCGVPRTLDVADLTREHVEIALIGRASPRRTQLVGLLQAVGATVRAPHAYLEALRGHERREQPSPDLEDAPPSSEEAFAWIERAIPDRAESRAHESSQPAAAEGLPSLDDPLGLARHVARIARETGAAGAALWAATEGGLDPLATSGSADPLMRALAEVAERVHAPQVVARLQGGGGRVWGAWPLRARDRHLVLAAGGLMDARAAERWEHVAFELEIAWNQEPGVRAPEQTFRNAWLMPAEFRGRLRLAVERHQQDGQTFAVHRLHVEAGPVELLCRRLPDAVRSTDSLCRPEPGTVLLLLSGPLAAARPVRERIARLWASCHEPDERSALAPIADERIGLSRPSDAEAFLASTARWLAGH